MDKGYCLNITNFFNIKKITDVCTSRVVLLEMLNIPWVRKLLSITVF